MAEIIHVIRTGSDTFNDIKAYLDKNPEYLLFQSPLGVTLKAVSYTHLTLPTTERV